MKHLRHPDILPDNAPVGVQWQSTADDFVMPLTHPDVIPATKQITLGKRLAAKTLPEPNSGCYLFIGAVGPNGYGRLGVGSRGSGTIYAHRASYEIHVGPIPHGLTIDHLCRNKLCVRPAHLEAVTATENTRRAAVVKTSCPQGHPINDLNTQQGVGRAGRQCRVCSREYKRRLRGRNDPGQPPIKRYITKYQPDDRGVS